MWELAKPKHLKSTLMCGFLFQLTSLFCNSARILKKISCRDDMHQFMVLEGFSVDIKLLTLKLIKRCNFICNE